jgi:hypothetical protein
LWYFKNFRSSSLFHTGPDTAVDDNGVDATAFEEAEAIILV